MRKPSLQTFAKLSEDAVRSGKTANCPVTKGFIMRPLLSPLSQSQLLLTTAFVLAAALSATLASAQTSAATPQAAPVAGGSQPIPASGAQRFLVKAVPPPTSGFVQVGALKLNYLDYGGNANNNDVAIVLLPGLTDTTHIFDDLAPHFRRDYPTYALTRRGCGDSDKSASGDYSTDSRVADLAGFLDALKIKKAILIGHSLAGDELTAFAAKYPARVAALVYLEAAYDRSQGPFGAFAHITPAQATLIASTPPTALKSIDAYTAYSKQITQGAWSTAADANMRDRITIQPDGSIVEKTPADVTGKLLIATATAHPDESQVKAPALCLFATFPSPADMEKQGLPAAAAQSANDWQSQSIAAAKSQMHAQVIAYPAGTSHYLFIQYSDRAAGEIQAFLDSPAVKQAAQ